MKEKAIIIGSGQHARVVHYNMIQQDRYDFAGCVTNTVTLNPEISQTLPILAQYNSVEDIIKIRSQFSCNNFILGFGNMKFRKIVFNMFISAGWTPITVIHPNAVISPEAKIGDGTLIEAGCLITPNPIIGNNVVINTGSQVNHDNIIEDNVYIASGVVLSGGVRVRENSLIDDAVTICLGREIGSNCIIGAGSVVTKNIPDMVVAYGNPCRIIRDNTL